MDEAQTTLVKQMRLAKTERTISHLQSDLEYYQKMQWSFDLALKKEEKYLGKIQSRYHEESKNQEKIT